METPSLTGRTEVLYGSEAALARGVQFMKNVRKQMYICFDYRGPSIVVEVAAAYRDGYADIRRRGGKIRAFTDITKQNVNYCKQLSKMVDELRHIDSVKGGVALGYEYMATTILQEAEPLTQVIYSSIPEVVEQGQYFFDMFWEKAIPAEQKIREIEEGVRPEVIETIRDPDEILRLGIDLAKSAKSQVLIIFSTANAFRRQVRFGGIDLLKAMARDRKAQIRILTPSSEYVQREVKKMKLEGLTEKIAVRYIEQPLQTKVTVLIIDKEHSLAVELKDDTKENARDAIGLATYSNSKATVSSYVSIFESLWNQAELYNHISTLYEQLRGHDKLQREFINIAAHELRTPIQPILGLAEVLRDRISIPDQSRLLDAIIRNAKRLLQLQEALLDITRIEANMLKLDPEVFELNSAVAEFLKDYRNQPYGYFAGDGGKNVELVFQPESNTTIFVRADKIRLNQVLSNLLSNATKFTREALCTWKQRRES